MRSGVRHKKVIALCILGSLTGLLFVVEWYTCYSAHDSLPSSGVIDQDDYTAPRLTPGAGKAVIHSSQTGRADLHTLTRDLEDMLLLAPTVGQNDPNHWLDDLCDSSGSAAKTDLYLNLEGWQVLRLFQHFFLQTPLSAAQSYYNKTCQTSGLRPSSGLRPFYTMSSSDTDLTRLLGALHCLLHIFSSTIQQSRQDISLPPSLPAYVENTGGSVPAGYFIAANLNNSTAMIPNFIYQLVQLVARVPHAGHVYVSIYESSSRDSTSAWLKLLGLVLKGMGVHHNIVVHGDLTLDMFGGRRIPLLAALRNAALQPLLEYATCQQDSISCRVKFLPSSILFVNDVFFTAEDAFRLLMHRQHHKADMACGLDFFFVAADNECTFYDIWVARDMSGKRFHNHVPFVTNTTVHASRLMDGWTIPVSCCWNGMVALNPEPFIVSGLSFRTQSSPSECYSSECSYLCDDMHRLGYHDMLVDSGVRITYSYNQTKDVQDAGICAKSMIKRNWAEVADDWGSELDLSAPWPVGAARLGHAKAFNKFSVPLTSHCCDGRDDERVINFNNCTDMEIYAEG